MVSKHFILKGPGTLEKNVRQKIYKVSLHYLVPENEEIPNILHQVNRIQDPAVGRTPESCLLMAWQSTQHMGKSTSKPESSQASPGNYKFLGMGNKLKDTWRSKQPSVGHPTGRMMWLPQQTSDLKTSERPSNQMKSMDHAWAPEADKWKEGGLSMVCRKSRSVRF